MGGRDGRLLVVDGRLQQLRDRAGGQVPAVDVHPGLPAAAEALRGILKLRAMIMSKPDLAWRTRYGGRGTEEFGRSELAIEPVAAHDRRDRRRRRHECLTPPAWS